MKIVQSLLPPAAVLVCLAFTFCLSTSFWLHERIHFLHKDAFTVELCQNGLWLATTLLPKLLVISLLLFWLLTKQLSDANRWRWQRNYCLVAALVTITLTLRLWQCPLAPDDTYIDYRYVQHWLRGQFDYNPGEHVMGFTSHLHLMVLWVICLLFQTQAVDMASYYTNCALDTINTVLLFFLVLKVYGRTLPAFLAALLFAVSTYNCTQALTGKESALVNLIILIALWSLKTSRLGILPWTANALFLLRPEGLLGCLVILATALKIKGRAALRSFIIPCAISTAWYAFLFVYFGSIIPHGLIAKHKVLPGGDFFSVFMGTFANMGNIFTNSSLHLALPGLEKWPFLPTSALIVVCAWWRLKEPCWALYKNVALVQLLLLMVGQSRIFSWYYCWFPLMVPLSVAQLTADATMAGAGKSPRALLTAAAVSVVSIMYIGTGFFFAPFAWMPYLERGMVYREAALFLQEKTKGKDVIAASDVGIVGYFYNGPVVDLMGLVSNHVLQYYPIKGTSGPIYLIPPEAISHFRPRYLMASITACQGLLLDDPDFKSHYTEIKRWTNPGMTDGVVCIWMRREESGQLGDN